MGTLKKYFSWSEMDLTDENRYKYGNEGVLTLDWDYIEKLY